jgi:hypothetical protein
MNDNTIPLQEALPWQPMIPRNILVYDSVETQGVFLLHAMVSQFFLTTTSSAKKNCKNIGRVLWLSGTCSTGKQIATSLKRMGCDRGDEYIRGGGGRSRDNNTNNRSLIIRSVAMEVADKLLLPRDENQNDFDDQTYLKQVYKDVKTWLAERQQPLVPSCTISSEEPQQFCGMCWIVLDDVSSMATILGEQLVYCFVTSLLSLSCRTASLGVLVRCSNDLDQLAIKMMAIEGQDQSGWVGAGGSYYQQALKYKLTQQMMPAWERCLETNVDAVVDVLPLPSGFSDDAHGRLIFSETSNGRGWGHDGNKTIDAWNKLMFNYCVKDTGVRAIRLRTQKSIQGYRPE